MGDERLIGTTEISRRMVLRGSLLGAAGLATAALIGCGSDDNGGSESTGTPAAGGPLKTTDKRPDKLPDGWVWDADVPFPY